MKKFIVLLLVVFGLFMFTTGCSDDSTPKAPAKNVSLNGPWHQTASLNSGAVMKAKVDGNAIQIDMTFGGVTQTYWAGSMTSEVDPTKSVNVTSYADSSKMKGSLFSSSDNTKQFTYNKGDLSYSFTMMGNTTTIHLAPGA